MILTQTFTPPYKNIFRNLQTMANFFLLSLIAFRMIDLKEVKYETLNTLGIFVVRLARESFLLSPDYEGCDEKTEEMLRVVLTRTRMQVLEIFLGLHIQKDVQLDALIELLRTLGTEQYEGKYRTDLEEMLSRLGKKFHPQNAYHSEFLRIKELIG